MTLLAKLRTTDMVLKELGAATRRSRILVLYDEYTESNALPLKISCDRMKAEWAFLQLPDGGGHGAQLPAIAAAAMLEATLVIGLTRNNITHTSARQRAQEEGVRIIALPESEGDDFFLVSGWQADFKELAPRIHAMAEAMTETVKARVVTNDGTDITMSLENRRGRALTGYVQPHEISAGYGLEASIAPLEGTANGRIIVNESVPGVLRIDGDPIEITVTNGYATAFEGGKNATRFQEFLAAFEDPEVYNIAELGVGMNPCCIPDGRMLTDENVFGNIQLALGTNAYIGGNILAAAHYDTIIHSARLDLDGKTVLDAGRLFI